MTIVISF